MLIDTGRGTPAPAPAPVQRDRNVYKPPARAYSAPSYNTGGGGGGGITGGGGSGISGGGGGGAPAAAPAPPPPSLNSWLKTDADYQDQLRAFAKTLADETSNITQRQGTVKADYQSGVSAMGDQRVKDLQDIMNDFAARGLLKSGLYGQRQADYEKTYNTNLGNLSRNETTQLGDLGTEQTQFQRQQELQKETARKEAAARRAAKFGL